MPLLVCTTSNPQALPHTPRSAPATETASPKAQAPTDGARRSFDAAATRHRGQYALRRLYHESDAAIIVMYTGTWWCGCVGGEIGCGRQSSAETGGGWFQGGTVRWQVGLRSRSNSLVDHSPD